MEQFLTFEVLFHKLTTSVASNSQTRLAQAGHIEFRELLHSQIFSRLRVGGFLCHSNTNLSIVYRGIFQIFKYILYSGKSLLSTISRSGPKLFGKSFHPTPEGGEKIFGYQTQKFLKENNRKISGPPHPKNFTT